MPRTAVHIVTYNSAGTIAACLDALLAQDADFAVLVIDNASADDTAEIVRGYDVTLHCNAENTGYAAAHNQALAMTESDYVLTLNPDVALTPGFIAALAAALDADPQTGAASGCLLRVDTLGETPQRIDSMGLFMRRRLQQGLRGDGEPLTARITRTERVLGPDGAAAFYRRAMLADIAVDGETFDEDFFMHKEDVDVCLRALLYGWGALYVPGAVAHHVRHFRPGRRGRVHSADVRRHAVRNRYLLILKNLPLALMWRFAPFILAYDVGIFAYLLLFERASLPAYADVWRLRGRVWHKRRVTQARRAVNNQTLARWFE
jgi:GT2 family glycosyltransferase